ncbi:MAG: DUF5329 family protein [Gammaproteobacteria bacterium]
MARLHAVATLAVAVALAIVSPALAQAGSFAVHDHVLAQWRDGLWYPARIKSVAGGRFHVTWDDGGQSETVAAVRRLDWDVGTRLRCRQSQDGHYYPGVITAKGGDSMKIRWDDGGQEERTWVAACRTPPDGSAAGHAAPAAQLPEAQKIDRLIAYVGGLKGALFIRSGKNHSPGEAAKHMQLKREKAGSAVKTADDFIRLCASHASLPGEAYLVRFSDGRTRTAEDVLREELARIARSAQ